jgi:hypothetical protein
MQAIILPLIFTVHVIVFGGFYITRGRQIHNLIFCIAFIFLIASRLHANWNYYTGQPSELALLDYASAIGTGLCIIATVFFIKYVRELRQAKVSTN